MPRTLGVSMVVALGIALIEFNRTQPFTVVDGVTYALVFGVIGYYSLIDRFNKTSPPATSDKLPQQGAEHVPQSAPDKSRVAPDSEDMYVVDHGQQLAFISMISHEVRTPMHAIMGLVELLNIKTDGKNAHVVKKIKTASMALLTVLDNTIEASRSARNLIKIQTSKTNVYDILSDAASIFVTSAEAKSLRLHVNIDPKLYALDCQVDKVHLMQVLSNLLGNAIKFTDRGDITLWAVIQSQSEQLSRIYFSIEDSGVGIPEDQQATIFSPFTQVDDCQAGRVLGSGLGLKISQDLVQLMGSEIKISSDVGKGSRFWFVLECETSTSPTRQLPVVDVSNKILLIGQQHRQTEIISHYLQSMGATVVTTSDIHSNLIKQSFALIIIDEQLAKSEPDGLAQWREVQLGTHIIITCSEQSEFDFPPGFTAWVTPLLLEDLFTHCRNAGILNKHAGQPCQPLNNNLQSNETPIEEQEQVGSSVIEQLHPLADKRFLIVDDSSINLVVLESQMQTLGLTNVVCANDGEEAMEIYLNANDPIDIVITDFNMPKISGPELAMRISLHNNKTLVFGLTAMQQDEVNQIAQANLFFGLIHKPCDLDTLRETLAESIKHYA